MFACLMRILNMYLQKHLYLTLNKNIQRVNRRSSSSLPHSCCCRQYLITKLTPSPLLRNFSYLEKESKIKQHTEIKSQQILIAHRPLSLSVMNHFLSAVRKGHGVDGGASFQKKPGDVVSRCTSQKEPRKSKDTGISLAIGYFHFLPLNLRHFGS